MVYAVLLGIAKKITETLENAFGVNLTDFLINLGATVLLFLIVRFVFWNKVTKFLDAKKEMIKEEYKNADEIKEQARLDREDADNYVALKKTEADAIIADAREDANLQKEEIIRNAKEEAKQIVEDSKAQAENERNQILKEAKDEVVDIASSIASKMISDNVDSDKYNEEALKTIGEKK
jgi:F-type H+-transporting ATPase subunit b